RDMEIITYVLEGAVAHKDSMGSGSTIEPGNVQRMSAGRGVLHSEFNPLDDQATHLLQIWIEPDVPGIAPEYEELSVPEAEKRGRLRQVASPDGADGSMRIHQDARVYAGLCDGAEQAELPLAAGRRAWVHMAHGKAVVNGQVLAAGDGLALTDEAAVTIRGGEQAQVLVFDLAEALSWRNYGRRRAGGPGAGADNFQNIGRAGVAPSTRSSSCPLSKLSSFPAPATWAAAWRCAARCRRPSAARWARSSFSTKWARRCSRRAQAWTCA